MDIFFVIRFFISGRTGKLINVKQTIKKSVEFLTGKFKNFSPLRFQVYIIFLLFCM